ncbi:MAG: glucosamine-6-phosphate deaminase [Oscillospiraceae bacterium]|nr:glucosamine-6-phosphate deaminase [Oscillospiraceae bacterium]MDD4413144.1 glucosamine-6-phosphate deaminase [Oscillospiraceae bacterium]
MRIIRTKDYNSMSRYAAKFMAAQIILKPDSVLGLATGSTPIGAYKQLIEWCKDGDLDFSSVKTVNLDEYCGLSGDHDQSYRYFMNQNLFNHLNIDMNNTNVPNGIASDLQAECKRYDELIKSIGGVDLQLLGIGHNGHIGFNEPNTEFDKNTHVVDLKQSTIDANARFFKSKDDVPKQALTMGNKPIMSARKILLVVSGSEKRDILERALYGPVTPEVPASLLQMHNDLTVVCCVD